MVAPKTNQKSIIDFAIKKRRVIVTCGTGGVGKTSLSAAIGFKAALQGKNTLVITIDPAKRLATSLGLELTSFQPTSLNPYISQFLEPLTQGSFSAYMPDTHQTFEHFVRSLSPSPALAESLIKSSIFEMFAREFSGTNEYMALEQLLKFYQGGVYDLIVLDTPPSRNTLDLLEAPQHLRKFFDEKMIKWLITPSNRIMQTGVKKALGLLEKIAGKTFMSDLFEFASGLMNLQVGLATQLSVISDLLKSDEVGFILVTGPSPEQCQEVNRFTQSLQKHKLNFDGLILNRSLSHIQIEDWQLEDQHALSEIQKIKSTFNALKQKEELTLKQLPKKPYLVPELIRDVHSLKDLHYVSQLL